MDDIEAMASMHGCHASSYASTRSHMVAPLQARSPLSTETPRRDDLLRSTVAT